MSRRRVVVTGLGLIAPVGLDAPTGWANVVAGKSGIQPITHFDVSAFSVRFGGPIYGFDVEQYIPKKEAKKMDPFVHYGIAAGTQAIRDAGIEVTEENAGRIGVAIGSGIGGLGTIESSMASSLQTGPRRISPFFVPSSIINMVAGNLSIMFGLKGPNISIVSACSTGAHNIADAMRMIQYDTVDVMVAGGAEMATTALGIGGFAAARFALVTAKEEAPPAKRKAAAAGDSTASMARLFLVMTAAATSGSLLFNFSTNANYEMLADRFAAISRDPALLGTLLAAVYAAAALAQLVVGRLIDRHALKPLYAGIVAVQAALIALASVVDGWAFYAVQFLFMAAIFGSIPFTDAMIVRYVDDRMRSRVSGMRLAVSFGASSLAVRLIGPVVKQAGSTALLWLMAATSLVTLAVISRLPEAPRAS